jgi:hypothetical protein
MSKNLLSKRRIVIATMHSKERVIAPLMRDAFQLSCSVPKLNTDVFGTFSGEVKRLNTAIEAARKKCALALEISHSDLAIASEGSFGPHPHIPFAQANEEIVLLYDTKHDLEVVGRHLTHETNLNGGFVTSLEAAVQFAEEVGFPSHGLIIREQDAQSSIIAKGIIDIETFHQILTPLFRSQNHVWIETDMRAMFNPTRMHAIEKATRNLIDRLKSNCPKCHMPGYWITNYRKGLPCSICHFPTQSVLADVYTCSSCGYSEEKMFPQNKQLEDPMYCDICNP